MAPTYLSPGVYVEEVDGGSKPIAAAGTAVAAFVGFAQKGPVNQLALVTNWSQYVEQFGAIAREGNTLVIPADISNVASMVALASRIGSETLSTGNGAARSEA